MIAEAQPFTTSTKPLDSLSDVETNNLNVAQRNRIDSASVGLNRLTVKRRCSRQGPLPIDFPPKVASLMHAVNGSMTGM